MSEFEANFEISMPQLEASFELENNEIEAIFEINATNGSTYVHDQSIASDTWDINHNLNKFPSVTVIDSTGSVITCAIQYIDENNCQVKANGAFKGKAYLN